MVAALFHVLNQVLRRVPVVSDLKRQDLVLLPHRLKPVEHVMVIDELIPGQAQEAPVDHRLVRDAVPLRRFTKALTRQPEVTYHPDDAFLFDQQAGAGQVRCLGQVDAAQRVAIGELFQFPVVPEGLPDRFRRQPCQGSILFDIAVLGQELALFADRALRDRNLFQDIVNAHGNAQVWQALPQLVDVVPLLDVVDHIQKRCQPYFLAGTVNDRRRPFHQLIIQAAVDEVRRCRVEQLRLRPCALGALDDLGLA